MIKCSRCGGCITGTIFWFENCRYYYCVLCQLVYRGRDDVVDKESNLAMYQFADNMFGDRL